MKSLTLDRLREFSEMFVQDPVNRIRMNAVVKSGLNAAATNQQEDIDNPMIFSTELKTGKVTSQNSSGRCWLFAGLNTMRFEIMKKLNLETFELSQTYQMFWDKVEKSNFFLESIINTVKEPLEGRLVAFILSNPIQDGGQWDMFCSLVDKYGCVPKSVMPETFHSSNSSMMNRLVSLKLREDAKMLRDAAAKKAKVAELREMKQGMMAEIYRMLCICLGEPPEKFDFECRDKDKKFIRELGITPKEFYKKYVGQKLADRISVINAPTADKPYNRSYTVDYLGNVVGGRPIKYLNLPSESLKRISIAQLSDGEPVWFGCDVGKMLLGDRGIMGMKTFEYEPLLDVSFGLDKAGRLDYGVSAMTHAMVFLGVNVVDGKPNRWKVENKLGRQERTGWVLPDDR